MLKTRFTRATFSAATDVRRTLAGLCVAGAAALTLTCCSSVSLDDLVEEETEASVQKKKTPKNAAEEVLRQTKTGTFSALFYDKDLPEDLSVGGSIGGMKVLQIAHEPSVNQYAVTTLTLLSASEWVGVPSANALENSGTAQQLSDECAEAGEVGWRMPTRAEAQLIRQLCSDELIASERYLCDGGAFTFARDSKTVSKAGTKKRYALRLVLEARFVMPQP